MTAHEARVEQTTVAQPRSTDSNTYQARCSCGWVGGHWSYRNAIQPASRAQIDADDHLAETTDDRRGAWAELDVVTCPKCAADWPFAPPEDRCDCGHTFPTTDQEDR